MHPVRICYCEQSGVLHDRSELSSDLSLSGIDYYRYNWRYGEKDPFCNVDTNTGLSWSKGREVLYKFASRGHYDYYIFADDDVAFDMPIGVALSRVSATLAYYRPLAACCRSSNWHNEYKHRLPEVLSRRPRPFLLSDLELQILSAPIAQLTFPVPFDGGWGTLWYPNVAIGALSPRRQLEIADIGITNARTNDTGYYGGAPDEFLREAIAASTFGALPRGSLVRRMVRKLGPKEAAKRCNKWMAFLPPARGAAGIDWVSARTRTALEKYFHGLRDLAVAPRDT